MNYKKIIHSRKTRILILSLLAWIPDRVMIPLQYRIYTGRRLNLKKPLRFTEKLQLYKLSYRNQQMLRCTDKYEVRQVVCSAGYKDILIPLIGVFNNTSEIDFEALPNEFVAKTSDGGGGNQVLICYDKKSLNRHQFYSILNGWMKAPKNKNAGREWAYENDYPRRIIIENLIKDNNRRDLPDFKFFCFNGKPHFCQLIDNRSIKETIDFYDMNWIHQDFVGLNTACRNSGKHIDCPINFDLMKDIASKLATGFPFVRVDLYNVNGKIYFGELTFYPASGFGQFTPDEWDFKIGNLFDIDSLKF